jgi:hypothetical protein
MGRQPLLSSAEHSEMVSGIQYARTHTSHARNQTWAFLIGRTQKSNSDFELPANDTAGGTTGAAAFDGSAGALRVHFRLAP